MSLLVTELTIREVDKLVELIKTSRNVMSGFAKAKTAKIGTLNLETKLRQSAH